MPGHIDMPKGGEMPRDLSDQIRLYYQRHHWWASKQDIAETFGVSVGTVAQALRYVTAEDALSPTAPDAAKRQISVREKSKLPSTKGFAIILPGRFQDGVCCEVEELLAVGYTKDQIIGIENDHDAYLEMFNQGCDIELLFGEAFDVIQDLSDISYAHFDFCGMLRPERVAAIRALRGRLLPVSRVRVTSYQYRRSVLQIDYEQAIATSFVHELMKHQDVPGYVLDYFAESTDIAPTILACISSLCPPAAVEWFEVESYGAMATAWVDLVPGNEDEVWSSLLEQAEYLTR
jgi:hypothetical protein